MADNRRPLQILVAHNRYLVRGGERQVFEAEVKLLRDQGHTVEIHVEDNERVAELGQMRTAARSVWSTETYRSIRKRLGDGRIDLVHVHNFFPLISPSIYYAARAEGVPVVQTLHNYRLLCLNALLFRDGMVCEECVGRLPLPGIRYACYRDSRGGSTAVAAMLSTHRAMRTWTRLVHTYIALSDFSRRKLIQGGLPGEKIIVKPNFPAEDPGPGTGRGQYALYVGRLSSEKGVESLLAAWQLVGDILPLKIVGDGPLQGEVIAAVESSLAVEYLGRVDNAEVLRLMQDACFLVFPSLCYENFPMTIVEAFAAGLPVLASNLGSAGDLIQPRRTGLHFAPGNAQDMADQVLWLTNNHDALEQMRKSTRDAYEQQFTASANYRLLRDIYENALARADNEAHNDESNE